MLDINPCLMSYLPEDNQMDYVKLFALELSMGTNMVVNVPDCDCR